VKEMLVKNIHWFLIAYTAMGLFTIYEEKTFALEQVKGQPETVRVKISKAKNKLKQIERFKKNLSKSKEKVKEVVKQIEKIQKQLPSDVNDTEVQSLIGDIAVGLKIRDPQPSPDQESNNGFYFTKEYKFNGTGTFLQFLIFFENLEKAERILNVKNFSLVADKSQMKSRFPILQLKTTIESYRYNTSYKEKSGVDEIESKYEVE